MTTLFIGAHYEVKGSEITKYCFVGTQCIAMRKNGTLTYMLSDHLGSTSLTTSDTGVVLSELRYTAWGEVRYQAGTMSTGYGFNGQFSDSYIDR